VVYGWELDRNKIVHFSKWSSLDKAKSFFESKELIEIREKAGVKSPEFIYLEQLENGVL
jgi:heme-degrading monooxygenase HmoA